MFYVTSACIDDCQRKKLLICINRGQDDGRNASTSVTIAPQTADDGRNESTSVSGGPVAADVSSVAENRTPKGLAAPGETQLHHDHDHDHDDDDSNRVVTADDDAQGEEAGLVEKRGHGRHGDGEAIAASDDIVDRRIVDSERDHDHEEREGETGKGEPDHGGSGGKKDSGIAGEHADHGVRATHVSIPMGFV